MRQVPDHATPAAAAGVLRYAILGNGRLATHLRAYFSALSLSVTHWSRCGDPAANTWAAVADAEERLQRTLENADTALVLFSDAAIGPFLTRHHGHKNRDGKPIQWVHCAASVVTDKAFCAHPLMTFAQQPYSLPLYRRMAFACDSIAEFGRIFPALANPVFEVPARQRPLYHALCVAAGNFPQMLWQECLRGFDRLNVPREALHAYLHQVLDNFLADPENALTGPLARGDQATIGQHLKHLSADTGEPAALAGIYRAFVAFHHSRENRREIHSDKEAGNRADATAHLTETTP